MNFKAGDKIVCTCGYDYCKKFFTVINWDGYRLYAASEQGSDCYFPPEEIREFVISEELYNSPFYQALK